MTFTRPAFPANPLTTRLLGSASLGAMMLAVSFATTAPALAQEITGDTGTATVLTGGAAIISGDTGGQFGSIDTNGGGNSPASITLTQSETIRVFDSDTGGDRSIVNGDFVINSGVTGTVIFAEGNDGNAALAADLTIDGDVEGAANGRGGTLNVSGRDDSDQSDSDFRVEGSVLLTTLTINGGDAGVNRGASMTAVFGNGTGSTHAFDVTGLTVTGGDALAAIHGRVANVTVEGDGTGANITTIGTDGITLVGGNGSANSEGGTAGIQFNDSAVISGAITITSGDEGTAASANGGDAQLGFHHTAAAVTVTGPITLTTGIDTAGNAGAAGNAALTVGTANFSANGGIIFSEQHTAIASLSLHTHLAQTFNGTVTAANDGDGIITITNTGAGVTLANDIGTSMSRIGAITMTDGDLIEFDGNVFVNTLTFNSAVTVTRFDGNVDATGLVLADNDTGPVAIDFNGALTVGANNFSIDAGGNSSQVLITISGEVGGTGSILLDDGSPNSGDAELNFDGTSAFSVANMIRGVDDNDGELIISNTAGVTFNGRLGTMTTQGDRAFRQMSVAANGVAIFNDDIGTQNFSVLGDGSTLTFNGAGAGPQMLVGNGGANGSLVLDDGTIILGSNIGNNDIIFDVTTGSGADPFAVNGTVAVQLSANVQNGDAITLIDGDHTDTIDNAEAALFTVTDTALTDFTIARTADGGIANANLVVTAAARTTAETAGILGVSTELADAVRQASQSGDTTLVDLLSTALNAGGTAATQAALQVGIQSETGVGGSLVSREMAGQQQGVTGDRIGGFRSDDPRFVTAFAAAQNGETGFAGGDLDAPYTPMGPRYANSVWGQVYGGTALADGTTALAGFDAGFGGALIGIDGAVTEDIVIGAFAGYGFADVDGDGAGNAQLETSAYQAGVYAGYTGASFYVDAFAAYAMTQNDTVRTTLGNNTVTGSFDASQITVGLSGGAPIAISPNAYLTPNASLTWNHYDADGYTEVGVGANTIAGFSANTLTGTIGARLHAVYEMSDGSAIIPELSAGLLYDLVDDDSQASATFVGGGTAYTVSGTEIADIGAVLGAGLTMRNDTWSFGLSYEGDIRSDFTSHTARAEIRMRF